MRLTTRLHDRGASGMTYVYPVVSRRARGVSVGVNLNTNNACNWRCVYCQVPGLVRGAPEPVDLALLERELDEMLRALVEGDYMQAHVPEGSRRLNDVAFSGNGEPTSSREFPRAVDVVRAVVRRRSPEDLKLVLITNGSLVHQRRVQEGLERLAAGPGEVWFKLDSATDRGLAELNDARTSAARQEANLVTCARIVPTWIQTMLLQRDGAPPDGAERAAYLACLARVLEQGVALRGVLLYGLARPSHQPEASRLSPVSAEWMEAFADSVRELGLSVQLSP